MAGLKLACYGLIFVLLVSFVAGVGFDLSEEELIFSFNDEDSKRGIISFETDTEPILISLDTSFNIDDYLEFEPVNNLKVSKKNPLVLKLDIENPGKQVNGYLMVNFLYEKLPEKVNYLGDDTIRIPIRLVQGGSREITKLNVELTEELPEGAEATALDVGVILPVVLIILLLVIFKRKWQKT